MGRTGHHEDCGCSNLFWSFMICRRRTIFLAGGTDEGRTGHHEDCGCSNLLWSFTKYRHHNSNANKKRRKANLE